MTDIKQNNPAGSFLQGTLILTIAGMVVKIIGSLNWIILSRVLGGEGIGLYQMAFPIYLLALSLSSAGIPVAISIITAEKIALQDYRGANRVFTVSLGLLTVSGFVLSILVYFGAGWLIEEGIIRDGRAYPAILALAPAIFLVTLLSSFRGYLQGWQMMTPTAVSQIVEQLFRVGTMLVFAALLLPQGIEYAAGGASLGAGFGAAAGLAVLIYYYFRLQRKLRKADQRQAITAESSTSLIRRMLYLALPVSLSSLMLPLVSNLDLFIVPLRLEEAGYTVEQATEHFGYLTGMAIPLVNLATLITAALSTALVPAMATAGSSGNEQLARQKIGSAIRLTNLVTIPAAVGLAILATPVAAAVYHAPQAGAVVQVVAAGVYMLGIHQVTTGILQGMGHTALPLINMGIAAVVKVILNWQLVALPSFGILGAGWATNADFGVAALLNLIFVYRYSRFSISLRGMLKILAATVVMGVVLFIVNELVIGQMSALLAILVDILVAVVVYGILLLLLGELTEQDIMRIPVIGRWLVQLLSLCGLCKKTV
ncbi:stage V sporulation protein B [Anaerospora hongkongensis]|uniref:Stage V sporulation protein B n=1 Tax=Anaerospora hongkongensis TaxID=244830 RepID=A0A4V2Q830_9FIRM|nr:polysaccharide biosynthesis protein [Anaerospora hongkongensis]TCL34425.1 stage V sporulation protein B [Anaerospora hongkongensis]